MDKFKVGQEVMHYNAKGKIQYIFPEGDYDNGKYAISYNSSVTGELVNKVVAEKDLSPIKTAKDLEKGDKFIKSYIVHEVIERHEDPDFKIFYFTVTERGYCHLVADEEIQEENIKRSDDDERFKS